MKLIAYNVALALSFFIYLSFLPLLNADGNNTLVVATCQKVKNKDLCISSLEAEHASQDADLAALVLIAIKVASNNGSDAAVYIKKTLDGTVLEPAVEQNFEDCSDNYGSATGLLDDALAALVSRDYKDVETALEATIDDATTSASVLNQSPGKESELFNKNNLFRQLCSNALDLLNVLSTN